MHKMSGMGSKSAIGHRSTPTGIYTRRREGEESLQRAPKTQDEHIPAQTNTSQITKENRSEKKHNT